jgi:hypothetical protein
MGIKANPDWVHMKRFSIFQFWWHQLHLFCLPVGMPFMHIPLSSLLRVGQTSRWRSLGAGMGDSYWKNQAPDGYPAASSQRRDTPVSGRVVFEDCYAWTDRQSFFRWLFQRAGARDNVDRHSEIAGSTFVQSRLHMKYVLLWYCIHLQPSLVATMKVLCKRVPSCSLKQAEKFQASFHGTSTA